MVVNFEENFGNNIVSVVEDEDGETYLEPIEDEALFNEIGDIFEERLADYFEFKEE